MSPNMNTEIFGHKTFQSLLHSRRSKSVRSVNIPTSFGMLPSRAFESIDHGKKMKHESEHDIKNPQTQIVVALTQIKFSQKCQHPNFTWNSASQIIQICGTLQKGET